MKRCSESYVSASLVTVPALLFVWLCCFAPLRYEAFASEGPLYFTRAVSANIFIHADLQKNLRAKRGMALKRILVRAQSPEAGCEGGGRRWL